jgi:hypothetical protein
MSTLKILEQGLRRNTHEDLGDPFEVKVFELELRGRHPKAHTEVEWARPALISGR